MVVPTKFSVTLQGFSHSFDTHTLPFMSDLNTDPKRFAHTSESVLGLDPQTSTMLQPHRKYHIELRLWLTGPRRPIHWAAKWLASHTWIGKIKYMGAPSYISLFIIVPLTNSGQQEIFVAHCVPQHLAYSHL